MKSSMKSFSFMLKETDMELLYNIQKELQKLRYYFVKFAGYQADEAMSKALMHTLTHFNPAKGDLVPFIKSLARNMAKSNGRWVYVDFLEDTLADNNYTDEEVTPTVDTGRLSDFSDEVVNKIDLEQDRSQDVINLALEFMDKFIILCEALKRKDTTTTYYPKPFIQACLKLSSKMKNFNKSCLSLYAQYEDDFKWFLGLDDNNIGTWKEADYLLIDQCKSKRVRLVNKDTLCNVVDADIEDWKLVGNFQTSEGDKKIIKINYTDVWELMCDLVDDVETNELKFIINNTVIIRTFGGSLSILNPNLYNLYDLIRMEILTNLLCDTNGRILNIGSQCFYLLCDNKPINIKDRVIRGYSFTFEAIDVDI